MTEANPHTPRDRIDEMRAEWTRELPDLDTGPMEIIARARRITLKSRAEIEATFARHGLDSGEFDVLSSLRRSGKALRPTELYRVLMVSSGGLSDRLARLEAAGLVRRRPSEEDRRSLLVELTENGRERIEAAFREDMAIEAKLIEGLSPDERRQLADLLRKLAMQVGA